MLIKKDIDYALRGLMELAIKPEERKSVRQIATTTNLPQSFLSKIFQKLSKVGIVENKFGPHGGFLLAKDPDNIPLSEILISIDENFFVDCLNYHKKKCTRTNCAFRGIMHDAESALRIYFAQKTLADLLN